MEPDRHAPVPPSLDEGEPSEAVVHVAIARIDVRAARPSGPRLTLADYLKRREERRR